MKAEQGGMKFKILAYAVLLLSTACHAEDSMGWPELPTSGFISGKVATTDDVAAGRAVFSQQGGSSSPIDMEIPQYALWTDDSGNEHPVIVVQAEHGPNGMEIVGLIAADGSHAVATLPELELLGNEMPSQ